ncbi:MAG: TIGR01777 family oxidoreductase [Bacteroidota bacterium]
MYTIVIAGGTGFLGQILESHFTKKGYTVKILTRKPSRDNHLYWDAKTLGEWTHALENSYALINLTGKSVDCRYNETNKALIHASRIDSTHALGLAVNLFENPPSVWLNSSTATIYKSSYDQLMTEDEGEIGDDFSMDIAKSWEAAFNSIITPKTRKVILRTAIVLGKHGGAFIPIKRLAQIGLGGRQSHGQQKVSWIHEHDFARTVEFLIENDLKGVFNVCVPKPTTNAQLMKSLRRSLKIPFGISQPKWLLELGAKLINTETELVLKSRNVYPKRLLEQNFKFKYASLELALQSLLKP